MENAGRRIKNYQTLVELDGLEVQKATAGIVERVGLHPIGR
jgi:hypothetical protein